ncbi:Uncharacterised protein [Paenibacillus macerans]|nr:Uncharacterised protein [Paenibacillus macerans]
MRRAHDDFLLAVGQLHVDQPVVLAQIHGNQAAFADVDVIFDRRLFDDPLLGRKEQVFVLIKTLDLDHRIDGLALFDLDQVDDRRTARRTAQLRNFVSFQAVGFAAVGEEHQIMVGVRHEQMLHKVIIFRVHPHNAAPAAFLAAVGRNRQPFDVTGMRKRDDDLFLRNQIFVENALFADRDFRPARIGVLLANFLKLLPDNFQHKRFIGQNLTVFRNLLQQLVIFAFDFLAFQSGQPAQSHIEDSLSLVETQTELRHQTFAGFFIGIGSANQGDNFVNMIQSDAQAFQDMRPGFGFFQVEFRAPANNFDLVLQIMTKDFLQRQKLRLVIDDRNHVDAERALHRRMFVQIVQDNVRVHIAAELDDDAHPGAVRFIAQIGDAVNSFFPYKLGDFLYQTGLIDHIRNFFHNDPGFVVMLLN